jgi:hypothetical protein
MVYVFSKIGIHLQLKTHGMPKRIRIVKDDKKVYNCQYVVECRKLLVALNYADTDEQKTIELEMHHATLRVLRLIHGVRQPKPRILTSEPLPEPIQPMSSEETVPVIGSIPSSPSLSPPPPAMGRTVNAAFLAFHYTDASDASPSCPDRIRLDKVQQMYSGINVYSVSEMKKRGATSIPHVESNFKKSLSSTLHAVQPELVILDYFWLEVNYFIENYGIDWFIRLGKVWDAFHSGFDSLAERLAAAGESNGVRRRLARECRETRLECGGTGNRVQVMILPFDLGKVGTMSNMCAMLAEKDLPPDVEIELMSMEDAVQYHPLVRATIAADDELKKARHLVGRNHIEQALRLDVDSPFVVIFRRGLIWREWLTGKRTVADGGQF